MLHQAFQLESENRHFEANGERTTGSHALCSAFLVHVHAGWVSPGG